MAVSVTARIWQQTYISVAGLKRNVACVAFGVPLISLPAVSKTLSECPKMESTLHLVYLKDDVIPRLMRFLDLPMAKPVPTAMFQHLALTSVNGGHSQVYINDRLDYMLNEILQSDWSGRSVLNHLEHL